MTAGGHPPPFRERLRGKTPLILDGGMGTMLIAAGLPLGAPPEAWVLERPDEVLAVHRAFVAAGSDAVQTCTFGASTVRLARYGLDARADEICSQAVRLARAAGSRYVIGNVGPSGEMLPPVGRADLAVLRASFAAQGRAFAATGVDALHIETMTDLREARCALAALREAAPTLPVIVSMTFERKKRGFFTLMGDAAAASLTALAAAGADGVGVNCSVAATDMHVLALELVGAVSVPLVIQPNAGSPERVGEVVRYAEAPEAFAEVMAQIGRAGVRVLGGCCGTEPRFIAALRERLGGRTSSLADDLRS